MAEAAFLKDLVIVFAVGVLVVAVLHRLKVPAIAGFILAGMLIGPRGLRLINDIHQVEILAEIGVALLLFGIGLELSLDKIKRLWRPTLLGGTIQVGLTILLVFLITGWFNITWESSIFIGFLIAISSTAIVLRGLEQRGEMDAPHGRLTLGILIFQDMCVVPMMLAIPILGGEAGDFAGISKTIGISAAIVGTVLIASRLVVPKALEQIAKTRQRPLFIMTVLLICLGTAWLTSKAGVSLALGAFLAGVVVAGSEFRQQALADLISFKEVFTSLFFVSVGMLLDPEFITANFGSILFLLGAVLIGKFIIVFLTALVIRLPLRVAVLSGAALAQIGEFSFMLIGASRGFGLLDPETSATIISAAILSMLITPFALMLGPHLAAGATRIKPLNRLMRIRSADEVDSSEVKLENHVIIGGYGFTGHDLAIALKNCSIPYIIVDINTENVHRARENGEPIYFGDITSPEVLEHLGIHRARELVIAINDPNAIERTIRVARLMVPGLYIIVRTNYILDIERLIRSGADEIIAAELEAAAEMTERVLNRHRVEQGLLRKECERIRGQKDPDKMSESARDFI